MNAAVSWRSGQFLIYDNNIPIYEGGHLDGWNKAFFTQVQRTTSTGGAPFDSLAGANTHKVCSDMRSHCSGTTNDHPACGFYTNPGSSCVGGQEGGSGICVNACAVDSDCGTGFQCVVLDGPGVSPQAGYPVRDQTGTSKDAPTTHAQSVAPFYVWNNVDGNNIWSGGGPDNHGGGQIPSAQVKRKIRSRHYMSVSTIQHSD
jgi:hypothetical protein